MGGNGQDGYYCTVCGGIPPDRIRIKGVPIDGKGTGIDRPDWILLDIATIDLTGGERITDELVKRVRQFNCIPTKKMAEYGRALLRESKLAAPAFLHRKNEDVTIHV